MEEDEFGYSKKFQQFGNEGNGRKLKKFLSRVSVVKVLDK